MGLYDKLTGKATAGADLKFVQDFFSENETLPIYLSFSLTGL